MLRILRSFMRGWVCVLGDVLDESDDLFLGSDEWLDVCLVGVCCSPDGYCSNEVGEDLAVVDVFECGCGEEFVGVFEALHEGWSFLMMLVMVLWCLRSFCMKMPRSLDLSVCSRGLLLIWM